MSDDKRRYVQVACPNCGKIFKVRFLELDGRLKYSVHCPDCKRDSVIEINKIRSEKDQ